LLTELLDINIELLDINIEPGTRAYLGKVQCIQTSLIVFVLLRFYY